MPSSAPVATQHASGHGHAKRRTVLVVDGDPLESLSIKRGFHHKSPGCRVHFCKNAAEAMRYLVTQGRVHGMPDAMVLDLERDGSRPMALIQKLRSTRSTCNMPIVVLSKGSLARDTARELGATGYVRKSPANSGLEAVAETVALHFAH